MLRLMKTLTLLITLILTFSLIGCNSTSSKLNTNDQKVEQKTVVENVVTEQDEDKENASTENTTEEKIESEANVTEKKSEEVTNKTDQVSSSTAPTNTKIATKTTEKKDQTSTVQTNNAKVNKTNETSSTTTTKPKTTPVKQNPPPATVTITISGPKEVGVILTKTNIPFNEGDTVLDVLLKASKKKNFLVEYRGSGAMAYIEGIDQVYEFDYGPKSGWNFKQNGTKVNKSSDNVKVQKDDHIEWIYSEDFTEEK